MFIRTQNKIYQVKFGLMGLILLAENPDIVAIDKEFSLYCGLISSHPDITLDEVRNIIATCDLSSLQLPNILSIYEIRELYTRAVGEMGITPTDFYKMTPEEIGDAYEGYLRKQETKASLMKIAFLDPDYDLIRLTEDRGYEVGNLQERNEWFKNLNVNGD